MSAIPLLLPAGLSLIAVLFAAHSAEGQAPACVLLASPVIAVTIPPTMPTEPLSGSFTVQCPSGWRVRAQLVTRGVLHGPLDLPYRIDTPVIAFTGTGRPQIISFTGRITLSGAIGTMVLPARYADFPLLALAY